MEHTKTPLRVITTDAPKGIVIVDDDEYTVCDCWSYKEDAKAKAIAGDIVKCVNENQGLHDKIEHLEMQVCDSCLEYEDDGTPKTGYGWNENAIEGQVPCVCITESGPYRELKNAHDELTAFVRKCKDNLPAGHVLEFEALRLDDKYGEK